MKNPVPKALSPATCAFGATVLALFASVVGGCGSSGSPDPDGTGPTGGADPVDEDPSLGGAKGDTGIGSTAPDGSGGTGGMGGGAGEDAGEDVPGPPDPMPEYGPYAYDLVVADSRGEEGLYRVGISDQGIGTSIQLVEASYVNKIQSFERDGNHVLYVDRGTGELIRLSLADHSSLTISHDLPSDSMVHEWQRSADTYYYLVSPLSPYAKELWQAVVDGEEVTHTQIPIDGFSSGSLYHLYLEGEKLYMPGFQEDYLFFEGSTADSSGIQPIELLDYSSSRTRTGSIFVYNGSEGVGDKGLYVADLTAVSTTGRRLSPQGERAGPNPRLHERTDRYFFATDEHQDGNPAKAYVADLSIYPPQVEHLYSGEDERLLTAQWSSTGRYLLMNTRSDTDPWLLTDFEAGEPEPRAFREQVGGSTSFLTSPDDRFFAWLSGGTLWMWSTWRDEPSYRIDVFEGSSEHTITHAKFSNDGFHIVFIRSDGRVFIEDTDPNTAPNPVDVTPADLPEPYELYPSDVLPHGGFLIGLSGADQDLVLLRSADGTYDTAVPSPVAGSRWISIVEDDD